ncbi:MAG: peptidoglycan-associated lipoprotein Pal [Alphaproteobacteria bacterium]|jgi:peptidoglycan-associated lipoprotein
MKLTIPVMIVAAFFLAACESTPKDDASASSGGDSMKSETMAKKDEMKKPMGPPPGSQLDLEVNVGDRVFFDFDKSNLKPEARTTIERWAAWLKTYPQNRVTIEGHCDERGTREYNLALGERRANAAKEYLVSLGISPNRINTISYGKERPAVLGSNEQAWAQNRRDVIVLQSAGS